MSEYLQLDFRMHLQNSQFNFDQYANKLTRKTKYTRSLNNINAQFHFDDTENLFHKSTRCSYRINEHTTYSLPLTIRK